MEIRKVPARLLDELARRRDASRASPAGTGADSPTLRKQADPPAGGRAKRREPTSRDD